MTRAEQLGYEVRRISSLLLDRVDDRPSQPADPGELATRIARAFRLRPIEVDLALTVLIAELDAEFHALLAAASPVGDVDTELGMIAALLPHLEDRLAVIDAIGPMSSLVTSKLLRRIPAGRSAQLVASRRFRDAILDRELLSALPEFASLRSAPTLAPTWVHAPDGLGVTVQARGGLCVVSGEPGVGKTSWALWAASTDAGRALYIDAATAAATGRGTLLEIRELLDDASLDRCPVVFDNAEQFLATDAKLAAQLLEALDQGPIALFLVVQSPERLDARLRVRALAHVIVEPPPAVIRRELWRSVTRLDDNDVSAISALVLTAQQIRNATALMEYSSVSAVAAAIEQLPKEHKLMLPDQTTSRLDAIVLTDDTRNEVEELIRAIRTRGFALAGVPGTRGRGISALFDGDSGTGKTFACEIVAAEVGLPLMRVNVSSLVDKYIGETEKNLSRVFEQAHALGGILFFDEADALFGNRTDVTRSADRYANLETNLLLQLMEQSSGVVLLTTNLKRNIDPAFMRRIMFKVYFAAPEPVHREQLWRRHVVVDRADKNINYAKLAETFELSGGSIRAAALRATYRSTAAGRKLTTDDLVECATLESSGMGRVATWK